MFKPYFMTVKFYPLPGKREQILDQMRKAIEYFMYPRLCEKFSKHPRRRSQHHMLPKIWLFPDVPVWKREKISVRLFGANDGGLHYQGPCLVSPIFWMKQKRCAIKLVEENQGLFIGRGISSVHLTEMDDEFELTSDYCVKHMKWNPSAERHVIILPRDYSELKSGSVSAQDRPMKDLQARYNLSDETAQLLLKNETEQRSALST
jgi:hypothetical protein